MTIKEFANKYQVILILSTVVVAMAIVKVTYKYEPPAVETKSLITPTLTATPTTAGEQLGGQATGEDYPLWGLIPYEEETFKIEKYSEPLTLVVKLKKGEKAEAYEKVIRWMEGLNMNLKAHKIVWN